MADRAQRGLFVDQTTVCVHAKYILDYEFLKSQTDFFSEHTKTTMYSILQQLTTERLFSHHY